RESFLHDLAMRRVPGRQSLARWNHHEESVGEAAAEHGLGQILGADIAGRAIDDDLETGRAKLEIAEKSRHLHVMRGDVAGKRLDERVCTFGIGLIDSG